MANILIIKHGALGDVVLGTGAMKAIRMHHPKDHVSLLTATPYDTFLEASGWFDAIRADTRPRLWQWRQICELRKWLNDNHFSRVYDLQTSSRSSHYYRLLSPKPEWSGVAPGCSHPHDNPNRVAMHTIERQREQLTLTGITDIPMPDIDWLDGDLSGFRLADPYALLVPGGSAHRPEKRWPADYYMEMADWLVEQGVQPVLIGAAAEEELLQLIEDEVPFALNLCGKTGFGQLAVLARGASVAVGNDTGPMHIIAVAGCPSLVLFSGASDPSRSAPRGSHVKTMQKEPLATLLPEECFPLVRRLARGWLPEGTA